MLFFKGLITGFILSLPFGPMGIYCMEKTLSKGEKEGFVSALGLITVDMIYGSIAFFFIRSAGIVIKEYEIWVKVVVAIFLLFVGGKKLKDKIELHEMGDKENTLFQNYITTFLLAIINITGILLIVGIFTSLEIYGHHGLIQLVSGIGVGGLSLWGLTTYLLSHFRKKITDATVTKISKFTGAIIFGFGVFTLLDIIIF
ncbi:MAG: LysE family translocator [Fusobacteriaceae bacterium]